MRCAKPSTTAVLPTPGSPISTGLFLVRRERICMTRSISMLRPMHGSSLPSSASLVRLRPNWSSILGDFLSRPAPPRAAARRARERAHDLVADLLGLGVEVEQDARRDALVLADQAEQDVLGADVVVTQRERLAQRQLEHLLGARRERDLRPEATSSPEPTMRTTAARTSSTRDLERRRARGRRRPPPRAADRAGGARCRCSCASAPAPLLARGRRPGGRVR